ESTDADRPDLLTHMKGDVLERIAVVEPIAPGRAESAPIYDHQGDARTRPRIVRGKEPTVVGEVRSRVPDPDPVQLIILDREAQFALEHGIGNLELAGDERHPAPAQVGELNVSVFEPHHLAALGE